MKHKNSLRGARGVRGSPWGELGELLAHCVSDALMLLDARSYKILATNRAFSTLYRSRRRPGTVGACDEIPRCAKSSRGAAEMQRVVEEAVRTGKPCRGNCASLTAKAQDRIRAATAYPIHGPSGTVERVLHVTRVAARSARKDSQRLRAVRAAALSQVAATLGHEINNPLTGILLNLRKLRRDASLSEEAPRNLQSIEEAASRIHQVVKKFERLRAGKTKEYLPGIKMIDLDEDP